jgi:hypothetical protein
MNRSMQVREAGFRGARKNLASIRGDRRANCGSKDRGPKKNMASILYPRAKGVSPAVVDGQQCILIASDAGSRAEGRYTQFLMLDRSNYCASIWLVCWGHSSRIDPIHANEQKFDRAGPLWVCCLAYGGALAPP